MPMKRAISPVIATVILIAITIIIGAAVAGWLLGLWGGFGDVESLRIYPDAKLIITSDTAAQVNLTIKNEGTRDARIIKIMVEGKNHCGNINNQNPLTIKAGEVKSVGPGLQGRECQITTTQNNKFTSGASYVVKIVTESGGVYQVTVIGRSNQG